MRETGRPYNRIMPTAGLILFAHGSRDPRWAEPFERLRTKIASRAPDLPIVLAYLELMPPDLAAAVDELAKRGCTALTIVPLFFGQGSHVRDDLPRLAADVQRDHPGVAVRLARTIGESHSVLDAIATTCLHEAGA